MEGYKQMAMRQVLLRWALLVLSLDLASPTHVVNGTFRGSAHFEVFVPIPKNFRVVWNLGEIGNVTVVAEIADGESPAYNPQYRGRSQLFDNGTLRMDNLTYADAGHYSLYVYDDDVFSTNIVPYDLNIYAALQPPSLSIVSDLIVHGTNVTLHCDAGNQTVTSYTFYRGQKMICYEPHVTCGGSSLDFTPISEDDSGSYTCHIQNPVSSNTSDPITVTVSVPVSAVTLTSNTSEPLLWPGRDSVSLRCSSNGTDVSYSWSLDGAPLPQDSQYQLTLNSSVLIISPISVTDNGYFMCTARNWINRENSTRMNLNLAVPVSAVTLTTNTSELLLWPGRDSVSLRCSSNGTDVSYSWSLDGAPLPQDPQYQLTLNSSVLIISPISATDNGYFICTAGNWINRENSTRMNLNLAVPVSAVTLTTNTSELLLWPGRDSVSLRCSSNGTDVSYSWSLDGAPLPQDPQYQLTLNSSVLIISPISATDNGYFICTAGNWINRENSTRMNLNLAVPVSAVTLTTNTSELLLWPGRDSVSLRCSSNGTDVSYSWSLDGAPLPQDPQYQLTLNSSVLIISPVSTTDNGYFMCTARNWINRENSTRLNLNLAVPVSAVTLTTDTSELLLWPGRDSVSLRCSSNGTDVSYSWSLDGAPLPQDPQYQLTLNSSVLIISPVSATDNGYFMCTARNWINRENSTRLNLNLAVPVSAVTLTTNTSELLLWPGRDSVSLRCSSNGTDVSYSWSLDGAPLPQYPQYQLTLNSSVLIISPVSATGNGYFMCTARNWINRENSTRLNLNLAVPVSAVTLTTNTSELLLWPGRDSVSLRCSSNGTDVSYSWSLDGAPLPQDPQYQLTLNSSVLIISPVSATGNGYFMCTARNWINRENSTRLNLNVAVPVSAVTLTTNTSELLLWPGSDSVSLRCSSNGTDVSYSWSLDGAPLPQDPQYQLTLNSSVLIISPVSATGNGYFMCTARNWINRENSTRLNLNLAVPISAVTLTTNTSELLLWPGRDSVSLRCSSNGTDVSYSWSLDGAPLPQYPQYQLTLNSSVLIISPISTTDNGYFMCTAGNWINQENSTRLNLNLAVPVSAVTLNTNTSELLLWPGRDSVSLRCSSNGTDVSYSWSLDGAPLPQDPQYQLTLNSSVLIISPISATDNGYFMCTARNWINQENSTRLNLNLAAPVSSVTLSSNSSSADLWAGQDSVSLHCSAQGSAIAFSWSLNGNPVSLKPSYDITESDSPPYSNLTISPVSRKDTGPFTCTASNLLHNETSDELSFALVWSPEGSMECLARSGADEHLELGCSWPGGNPPADVTMRFNHTLTTAWSNVTRNVFRDSDLQGSELACLGDQMGRTSSCSVALEPPRSPAHNNSAVINMEEGGTATMTVTLTSGLPAQFTWLYLNPDPVPVQARKKFIVESNSSASSLLFSEVTERESGKYECRAVNVIGTETFNFNLRVTKQASHGLSGGAIAGIVIGVLAALIMMALLIFILIRRKASKDKSHKPKSRR